VDRGAVPGRPAPAYDAGEGVLVTFGFRCNFACTFCMVEDVLDKYDGATVADMRARLSDPRFLGDATRVVLSGGEATLETNLLDYVKAARDVPQVRHVRVQTNGSRLANRAYLKTLVDAGVDEFFVSIHGHDADTCDALTQRKGSFHAILAGMEAIAESGAALYTNTVVWRRSYAHLAELVRTVSRFEPRGMEFWNLWPRVDPHDHRDHLVPVGTSAPFLRAALDEALARGVPPKVKFFPRCLLGEHGHLLDDAQPSVLVESSYWESAPRYACIHQYDCEHSPDACSGLSFTYVRKYGWEQDVLQPLRLSPEARAAREAARPKSAAEASMEELDAGRPVNDDTPEMQQFTLDFALTAGRGFDGWTLGAATVSKDELTLPLTRGDDLLHVRLAATDPTHRAFARTRSIDVSHGPVPESLQKEIAAPLRSLHAHLDRLDSGSRRFPQKVAGFPRAPLPAHVRPTGAGLDFLLHTTGTTRDDSEFLAVFDAVSRTFGDAAQGPDLETSAKLSVSGAESRRYLVQLDLARFGNAGPARVSALLDSLGAPASVFEGLEKTTRGPDAVVPSRLHVMLGCEWSDDPAKRTRRIYVEQARDQAATGWGELGTAQGPDGRLFALAWEWVPADATRTRLRRYFDLSAGTTPNALISAQFGAHMARRFAPLVDAVLAPTHVSHAFRRTDADDAGGRSEAVQFIVEPTPVARIAEPLAALARAVDTPDDAIHAFLERSGDAVLRVVGVGRTRDGRWHLTPYLRSAGSIGR